MTHTPGPWEFHKYPSTNGGHGFVIRNKKHKGIVIANLSPGNTTDRIEPIAEANARLIATTPELLEVVRAMASFDGRNNNPHLKDRARAALAKAEGRE